MIITKLTGGIGNQMFQYAIGRNLAHLHNTELKLDLSFYNKKRNGLPRNYSLNNFNIIENIATNDEIKKLKKHEHKNGRRHFLHNLFFADKSIYLKEKEFNFYKDILKNKKDLYLDGNWASEKYFSAQDESDPNGKNIEIKIRNDFTLKNKLETNLQDILTKIKDTSSTSLHIRKTDYITTKKDIYHSCPLSYYYQAIEKIAKNSNNLQIFVFSDDISWCKENLKTDFPTTFVEGNKDYEDLILMSFCKHNIIANSSFSWWGAWLNKNPDKIVIAPKKWFNNPEINTEDLIPKSWIQI